MNSLGFLADWRPVRGRRTRPQKRQGGQRVGWGLSAQVRSEPIFRPRGKRSGSVYFASAIVWPGGSGHAVSLRISTPPAIFDPSAEEPVMRKIFFVIAIAAAVVGAGVVVASLSNPELAAAKCTSRC